MDMKKVIARINELAAKKRQEGLNEVELQEQKELYKVYLSTLRGNLENQIRNIEVVEEDPNRPGEYITIKEAPNFPKTDKLH